MAAIHHLSVVDLAGALTRGELTALEVTEHQLDRISRLDTRLGAFVEVTAERALTRAARTRLRGPLAGVPFADKDLVARAGVPTRYGSRVFAEHVPDQDDPLAAALDAVGGVSLGKTTTPEFGLTGFTEPAAGPAARNPWDTSTGAGGSSGGAAVAVAAGLLPWAPASDGGGSIRIPAATCGVVGLKPARGRLPLGAGLDTYDALSVNGPITRSVTDAAFLLDVMSALAPSHRAVTAPGDGPFSGAVGAPVDRMRVGTTLTTPWDGDVAFELDEAANRAVAWAARTLDEHTAGIDEVAWSPQGYPALFRTLWRASAASLPLDEKTLPLAEPITAWLAAEGRALPARQVIETYAAARMFERATISAFAGFDAILTPALAMSPRPLGWFGHGDPEDTFDRQVMYAPHTSWVNVAGLPAITVPVLADDSGRPWSVQLVGRPGGEAAILALAGVLETARGPLPHPPPWNE